MEIYDFLILVIKLSFIEREGESTVHIKSFVDKLVDQTEYQHSYCLKDKQLCYKNQKQILFSGKKEHSESFLRKTSISYIRKFIVKSSTKNGSAETENNL